MNILFESVKNINNYDEIKRNHEYNYIIPTYVNIEPNLDYIVALDKTSWNQWNGGKFKDLSEFDINRWLIKSKDGNELNVLRNEICTPFSYGARTCPGKTVAIKELYSVFANLILNYQFGLRNEDKDKKIQFFEGTTKVVDPQIPLIVSKRHQS